VAQKKFLRQTSGGPVVIEPYEDETYVTHFGEDGWSVRDGPHSGEVWEALFYVAGVDEAEAKQIEAEVRSDPRYQELSSGARNVTVLALIAMVAVLALVVLGAMYLIQLVV
jgi:hypothetical protein